MPATYKFLNSFMLSTLEKFVSVLGVEASEPLSHSVDGSKDAALLIARCSPLSVG